MPLIAWAVASFAAGLVAAMSGTWEAALVAAALLAWWSAEDIAPPASLICFAAGLLIGMSTSVPRSHFGNAQLKADSTAFTERSRLRAAHNIDVAFGDDAPLAKALLVADQSEIPREIKDLYADAGIVHMLSISGMHVTIIAGSVALVMQLLRLPTRVASIAAVCVVLAYVCMLGFPPPAVRSAVMVTVVVGSKVLQRHSSRWAALALGALFPLLRPETVLDLGYQLSIGGMAGLIAGAAVARRTPLAKYRDWRGTLGRALLISIAATVVTGPLVASAFGRLSVIAPLTNLVADPVLALAQPMLFLALVLAPWPAAAHFVAIAAHPLLQLFNLIAWAGASVPYAAVAVAPSRAATLLLGVASVAIVVACVSRFPARAALVATGAIAAAAWIV
ncbi:MAG: ComEC/Rec2 family competence protein [Gemmatimonadaceae bacterium]